MAFRRSRLSRSMTFSHMLPALLWMTLIPATSSAQAPHQLQRLEVRSCPVADSILGQAEKDVLKATVYGTLGPGPAFELRSGPVTGFGNFTLGFHSGYDTTGVMPLAYLTAWLPSRLLRASAELAEPMKLVLTQDDSIPLGTPNVPLVHGPLPPRVPFTVPMRPEDLLAALREDDVRLAFLGVTEKVNERTREEWEATARLAVCQRVEGAASGNAS